MRIPRKAIERGLPTLLILIVSVNLNSPDWDCGGNLGPKGNQGGGKGKIFWTPS